MRKKAEGLSLTTIVIAALALLVLIILSVIFVGRIGRWNEQSLECEQRGGVCYSVDLGSTCREHGEFLVSHPDARCFKDGDSGKELDDSRICCVRTGNA